MTVNRTEYLAKRRLPRDLQQLKHQQRALKTPQPLGADVLAVSTIPSSGNPILGTSPSILAGHSLLFTVNNIPKASTLTLWNFTVSVAVDSNAVDGSGKLLNRFPDGASLTAGQANMTRSDWVDQNASNNTTNTRAYLVYIVNNDSSAHVYYLFLQAFLPSLPGSSAS